MLAQSRIEVDFIQGGAGKLFALHYAPESITDETECIVAAASFAEEMNRCRYMCTLFAQQVSQFNYGFLSVDTYGTGDSEGEFKDSNWEQGCQDLLAAITYAGTLGYQKISILGVRLGALQAVQIAGAIKCLQRLIFWQPVINGQAALTQFLRIRIAASMQRGEQQETVQDLENQINNGQHISVSGYDVGPDLFKGIKAAKFNSFVNSLVVPVGWFTVITSADRKTPRGDMMMIEKWRERGARIDHQEVIGPPFWLAHERTLVPELVEATVRYVTQSY
ncbi:exosortase A system-associated hydrolase 2 [Nitrosomonas sp. Nm51]|uniref:hydrolase 2, exosortase A system-associated n=1 Tax=Nitrosomonas sp. Nm51 TaxID=133720 RepID=UPI0008C09331|nr:hydrolase 2, exosortase A system-associated [Nitrosomonas sp. Nm51]SER12357.1 exosortase A system-associated hydrolase 2 [Nitrosomonas sp. Nm51]